MTRALGLEPLRARRELDRAGIALRCTAAGLSFGAAWTSIPTTRCSVQPLHNGVMYARDAHIVVEDQRHARKLSHNLHNVKSSRSAPFSRGRGGYFAAGARGLLEHSSGSIRHSRVRSPR